MNYENINNITLMTFLDYYYYNFELSISLKNIIQYNYYYIKSNKANSNITKIYVTNINNNIIYFNNNNNYIIYEEYKLYLIDPNIDQKMIILYTFINSDFTNIIINNLLKNLLNCNEYNNSYINTLNNYDIDYKLNNTILVLFINNIIFDDIIILKSNLFDANFFIILH